MPAPSFVQRGSTIVVQLGDDEEVACRVIWLQGNDIGLSFYEPIDARAIARALGLPEPEAPAPDPGTGGVQLRPI